MKPLFLIILCFVLVNLFGQVDPDSQPEILTPVGSDKVYTQTRGALKSLRLDTLKAVFMGTDYLTTALNFTPDTASASTLVDSLRNRFVVGSDLNVYYIDGDRDVFVVPTASASQTLSIDSTGRIFTISLTNGGNVKFEDTAGASTQTLTTSNDSLFLSGNPDTVSLKSYLDNTDDQIANEVNITDGGGFYTGTEVEAALQEVGDSIAQHRIDIDAGGAGETNTISSQGSGTSIYYQKAGVDLQLNAIKSENNRLGVALDGVSHDVELTINEANIDHDALANFAAGEHFTQSAISITESQISDLVHTTNTDTQDLSIDSSGRAFTITLVDGGNVKFEDTNTDTDTQLSQEQVEDFAFDASRHGTGTQTLIDVTYQDASNNVDYVVDNDLANYNNTNSAFLTSEVDGSITNEIQTLSITNDSLFLSGNPDTVSLKSYLDNTDTQDLSIDSTGRIFTISLADGGSVKFEDTIGAGESNTMSNEGTGTSIYYQKDGVNLELNAIKSENALLSVNLDAGTHDIELTLNESSIDHDALTNFTTNEHFLQSAIDIPLSQGANDVTATSSELNLLDLGALTDGWVLSATGAATASWSQLNTSDLNNDSGFLTSGDGNGIFDAANDNGTIPTGFNANLTNTLTLGNFFYLDESTDEVAIGTSFTSPEAPLHIYAATAGTVTASDSPNLILEGSVTNYLQFQSLSGIAGMIFGDPGDNDIGALFYQHASNDFSFKVNGVADHAVISSTEFKAGNYPFNIDQDTTGLDGQVLTYNATSDQITLTPSGNILDTLGAPTYYTVQDWNDVTQSSGVISGGLISDGGSGTIDISAVKGIIKITDSEIGENVFFDLGASAGLSLTDEVVNYVAVDYNSGTPQFITGTSNTANGHTIFNLGKVYREGTGLDILNSGLRVYDLSKRIQQHHVEQDDLHFVSGAIVSETGTLNIAITAGVMYAGLNRIATDAINTAVADDFEYYYYNGSAWIESDETQIDNTQYNNVASGLATLANNKYGVHWVFKGSSTSTYVVYGQESYTLADAQAAGVPSSLPDHVSNFGIIRAKIIIDKSASVFTEIENLNDAQFVGTSPANHNELGGLQGGTADEYYHLTSAEYSGLHSAVTLAGNDYLTLSGQEITANDIDLADDMTGNLPVTNLNSGTDASATTFWRGDGVWETPAGGGGGWTVNTETLTGDITLTADSSTWQILNPNGGTKNITLPDSPDNGTVFYFKNNDAFNSSSALFIKDSGGQILDYLYANDTHGYVWSGTYWEGTKYPIDFTGVGLEERNISYGFLSRAYSFGTALGASSFASSSGVAVGYSSNGNSNGVAIGYTSEGLGGVAIGFDAEGPAGIAIGKDAGDNITSATGNLLIGHNIDAQSATAGSEGSIGNILFFDGGFGTGTSVGAGNVMIGSATDDASHKLQVTGDVKFTGDLEVTGGVTSTSLLKAYKTADQTKTEDVTYAIDADVQVEIEANGIYSFTMILIHNDGATGDMKIAWSYPTGTTMYWTDDWDDINQSASIETGGKVFTSTGANQIYNATGIIYVDSTAGTFGLKWAQQVSDATGATLKEGTNIILTKLN